MITVGVGAYGIRPGTGGYGSPRISAPEGRDIV